jgi:hypothetical protein
MGEANQIYPPAYTREAPAGRGDPRRRSWMKKVFRRPVVVTARILAFALTVGWTKLWRKRPGSKPPHWAKDVLDIFGTINLVPTFFVMVLAPGHFFRRAVQIRKYGSNIYKTPIKFAISAVPFVVGLHWLAIGWLYKRGLIRFLLYGLHASGWGLLHAGCCSRLFLAVMGGCVAGEQWVLHRATDTQIVSVVLLGIPIWVPLVSGFIAVTLVYPYGLVGSAKSLRSFLIALDPRTYFRLRLNEYAWGGLYFAVYFTIAFPLCLLALYGIYHDFLYPSSRIMQIGLVKLWVTATAASFVASLLIGPYNELLKASVLVPTPLMLRIDMSRIASLLEGLSIDLQLARKGNLAPLERTVDSLHRECRKLQVMHGRYLRNTAKASERWKRKLATERKKAFSDLRTYLLSEAEQVPVTTTCKGKIALVSQFLLDNGATPLPEVVPPKLRPQKLQNNGSPPVLCPHA